MPQFNPVYMQIDDEQVYDILQSMLGDFKTFIDAIAVFLKLDKL